MMEKKEEKTDLVTERREEVRMAKLVFTFKKNFIQESTLEACNRYY